MKLFLAQINNIVGDIDGNLKRAIDILDQAEELNSDLVVFSELFLSGYPPEDLVLKKSFVEECRNALDTLINYSKTKKVGLIVGLPIYEKNNLFNGLKIEDLTLLLSSQGRAIKMNIDPNRRMTPPSLSGTDLKIA